MRIIIDGKSSDITGLIQTLQNLMQPTSEPTSETETDAPVLLYCIKDYYPGPRKYFGLTKGKVYTFQNGDIVVDGQAGAAVGMYDSYDTFVAHNPSWAACLVRMVKRNFQLDGWVYIDAPGTARHGQIGLIKRAFWNSKQPMLGIVCPNVNPPYFETANLDNLYVLENYKPQEVK